MKSDNISNVIELTGKACRRVRLLDKIQTARRAMCSDDAASVTGGDNVELVGVGFEPTELGVGLSPALRISGDFARSSTQPKLMRGDRSHGTARPCCTLSLEASTAPRPNGPYPHTVERGELLIEKAWVCELMTRALQEHDDRGARVAHRVLISICESLNAPEPQG